MSDLLRINDVSIAPGTRTTVDLPVGRLYTNTPMSMPVHVICGKHPGPRLFISAAIHGDEIIGVEIIRRLMTLPAVKRIRGALLTVPIVNAHGLINHSRYLPDRRDLNRSFPGSVKGSLAARLAHLFMNEIVLNSTHGIDIHTGAQHRDNLPQIRANLDEPETLELARAFGVPVLLNSTVRDGSLRQAAADEGIPMLLYEAGEALRFDELSIRAGVKGIINVMHALHMLPERRGKPKQPLEPFIARTSTWIRAPNGGILRPMVKLGKRISKGDLLGIISEPFGESEIRILAPANGIVIGRTNLPLANEGDALFHVARFDKVGVVAAKVEEFQEEHHVDPDITPAGEGPIV